MSTTGVVVSKEEVLEMNKKLRNDGFVVDVSFKRKGHYITVSPKLLGADVDNNEELREFFSKHVKASKVSFLDDNRVKGAENISKSTHKDKRKRSLGQSGSLMTREMLNDFKSYLEGQKEKYFEERDKLVQDYDDMVLYHKEEFKEKLVKNTMTTLSEQERDELVEKVFKRIPSRDEYFNSFDVTIKTTKVTLVEELDESEAADALQDTIQQVNEITGKNLSISFDALNNLMEVYHKNGILNARNRSIFTTVTADLKKRNLFNDAVVEEIIGLMAGFKANHTPDEEVIEEAEVMVSKIYGYALEIGVADALNLNNATLTEDEMLEICDLFTIDQLAEIELEIDVDDEVELYA